jgi:hypothetical protein
LQHAPEVVEREIGQELLIALHCIGEIDVGTRRDDDLRQRERDALTQLIGRRHRVAKELALQLKERVVVARAVARRVTGSVWSTASVRTIGWHGREHRVPRPCIASCSSMNAHPYVAHMGEQRLVRATLLARANARCRRRVATAFAAAMRGRAGSCWWRFPGEAPAHDVIKPRQVAKAAAANFRVFMVERQRAVARARCNSL